MAPSFKPAYLIHGDDHGRIVERRARLRELAESISGAEGVELLEGDDATPERAAAALDAMTLTLSRRFIIVEGVERWKDKELDALAASLGAMPPRPRSRSSPARRAATRRRIASTLRSATRVATSAPR